MSAKDDVIREISAKMVNLLSADLLQVLESKIATVLYKYEVSVAEHSLTTEIDKDSAAIKNFFIAKKVEGLSDKSLAYYKTVIANFFRVITIPLANIDSNTIRYYMAIRMEQGVSKVTLDNERRVLKSFFNWLSAEDFIGKSPLSSMKPIKQEKRIKKSFSEVELEKIRRAALEEKNELKRLRDVALVEFLYSTGARVSEVAGVKIEDIQGDECIVFGKGAKERAVFLNAKCNYAISEYLKIRKDNNPFLFVATPDTPSKKEKKGLSAGSIEVIIRQLGEKAKVENCHPHRFRRTMATAALNRGMPLEEVSQLLGHEELETTTIYARSDKGNIKTSHKKYIV